MNTVLKWVQVNMPFQMLVEKYLTFIIERKINPEIGLNCFVLDRFTKADFSEVAERLRDAGVTISIHAPFYDLRPGALDPRIRQVTIDRLSQVFDLVPLFNPVSIVCHASFDLRYYVSNEELWLKNSVDTWLPFAGLASEMETMIALENVYEETPEMLARLLCALPQNAPVSCCFDTGHFNAFSKYPLKDWLDAVGFRIGEVHLHDNDGFSDMHAPVGDGTFSFSELFAFLNGNDIEPVITLEPHNEEDLWRTLHNLDKMKVL